MGGGRKVEVGAAVVFVLLPFTGIEVIRTLLPEAVLL
jgi:hypothetical protein